MYGRCFPTPWPIITSYLENYLIDLNSHHTNANRVWTKEIMTLCRLLCDFLNVFPNIRCLMCCHWDPRVDNSVMGGFCDQRALCFPFAFCSPAPVEAVKSKDVTRDHRHKRSRNLSLPPGGMIRVFPGWMELHKICSLILKQESHKSAWAAATTQRF